MIGTLGEILKNMDNGTFNFCKNGECQKEGNCCGNLLPITDKEIKEIKCYMEKHNIKEQKHINALLVEQPIADLTCPFLDNSKELKCTIYEVRPKVCRDFICDPEKRPPADIEYARKCFPVNMRDMFFGK